MESKNSWTVEEAELVSNSEGGPEESLLVDNDKGFSKEEVAEIGECDKIECYHKKKLIELQLEKDTLRDRTEEELAKCNATIEQMVKDLKNFKDTAEIENMQLLRKNHVLELENKALKEDLEEVRNRDKSNFDQYVSAKKEASVKYNLLEDKLEEKQAELIGLRNCFNQAQIRIQLLERQIKDFNEESFGFQERMLQMKAQYEDDLQKIMLLDEQKMENLESKVKEQIETLQKSMQEIKEDNLLEIETLTRLEEKQQEISELRNRLNEVRAKAELMERQIKNYDAENLWYLENMKVMKKKLNEDLKEMTMTEHRKVEEVRVEFQNQMRVMEENFRIGKIVNLQAIDALEEKLKVYKKLIFKLRKKLERTESKDKDKVNPPQDEDESDASDAIANDDSTKAETLEPKCSSSSREKVEQIELESDEAEECKNVVPAPPLNYIEFAYMLDRAEEMINRIDLEEAEMMKGFASRRKSHSHNIL